MNTIIDAGSELLIDRSTVTDPFVRLIVSALGKSVVEGSAWVSISKQDLGRAHRRDRSHERSNSKKN